MIDFELPIWGNTLLFLVGALAIGVAGTKLTALADRLADRTGLGEAVVGMVLLGLVTSLPGVTASVTAAATGYPALSASNALGGIAVQTALLAIGDIFYPKANLEHAAASVPNIVQVVVLILLLTFALLGFTSPEITVGHVHPVTVMLFLVAGIGIWLVYRTKRSPMWKPERTAQTVEDEPDPEARSESLATILFATALTAVFVLVAGALVASAAGNLVDDIGVSETIMGGLFTAVTTSLPELVTTVAAVRRGALTLAVGDVVGGNFFDVLFISTADLSYFQGSLYHATQIGEREVFLTGLTILLNVVLLLGLVVRQRKGPGNIGFESASILIVYVAGILILSLAM